jgi:proteasome assembly chaperone (PAC2) family protein
MQRLTMTGGAEPALREPRMFAAWPGMGNVAIGAGVYLHRKLGARVFARVDGRNLYHASSVKVGDGVLSTPQVPRTALYAWRNPGPGGDLVVLLGAAQPPLDRAAEYAQCVVDVARRLGVSQIYTAAAAPVNRPPVEKPRVWGVATHREVLATLRGLGVRVMGSGEISGLNGLLLGVAKESGMRGMCLLGEIPVYAIQVPNPQASLAVLRPLVHILGAEIDFAELEGHARHAVRELRRMIALASKRKDDESGDEEQGGEEEEEVEEEGEGEGDRQRQIPAGVRRRIEQLFERVKNDRSKASALKAELDAWGLFEEYEDRFLDLFIEDRGSHH